VRKDKFEIIINEHIPHKNIRVVFENGDKPQVMTKDEALDLAEKEELDLVLIASQDDTAIVKLCRADKYLFQKKQKEQLKKKNSKKTELKEIKLGVNIDVGDLKTKTKKIKEFLADKKRVKISMRLRRRQMSQANDGIELIKKLIQDEGLIAEKSVQLEGNLIAVIVKP